MQRLPTQAQVRNPLQCRSLTLLAALHRCTCTLRKINFIASVALLEDATIESDTESVSSGEAWDNAVLLRPELVIEPLLNSAVSGTLSFGTVLGTASPQSTLILLSNLHSVPVTLRHGNGKYHSPTGVRKGSDRHAKTRSGTYKKWPIISPSSSCRKLPGVTVPNGKR